MKNEYIINTLTVPNPKQKTYRHNAVIQTMNNQVQSYSKMTNVLLLKLESFQWLTSKLECMYVNSLSYKRKYN